MTSLVTSITQSVAAHRLVSAMAATILAAVLLVSLLATIAHSSGGSDTGRGSRDTVDCGAIPHNRSIPHVSC
jgi:phage-related minor tail protein